LGSTREICLATGALLVANWEICHHFAARGVEKISPGNQGGTIDLGSFRLSFVGAHHSSSSIAEGMPPIYLGNPAGIVITAADEKTLLHMGDTDIFSDMALINEIHQPKIGIVPIGDRFTMGGNLAAFACNRFYGLETAIPCHYATFPIIDQTADKFVAAMRGSKTRVLVPERGVAVEL
jgi:L-ascorbate metabolism protein UlaG (beta-lactamase superfamily)